MTMMTQRLTQSGQAKGINESYIVIAIVGPSLNAICIIHPSVSINHK